jgi:hypothetical protein
MPHLSANVLILLIDRDRLGIDVVSGSVFCSGCDDLIYHAELEALFHSTRRAESGNLWRTLLLFPSSRS